MNDRDQTAALLAELDELRLENAGLHQDNAELRDACQALQLELNRLREQA